jgi:hypothetical protein
MKASNSKLKNKINKKIISNMSIGRKKRREEKILRR